MIDRRMLIALPPALLLATASGAAAASLHWDSHYLFLPARVNGRSVEALIDFSLRTTLVDRGRAALLGIGPDGAGIAIEAAGVRLVPVTAKIVDLADYANQRLRGRIGMVLGRDLFAAGPWSLDLAALALRAVDQPTAHRGTRLRLIERSGIPTIPVTIDGIAAQVALSFNDLDAMRISAPFAARVASGRPFPGRGDGLMRAASGVSRVDIAGVRITDLEIALQAGGDRQPDAWLGPAILRRFRLGIDLAGGSLWLTPR